MDKNSYVEKAPPFYALALAVAFAEYGGDQTVTLQRLENAFGGEDVAFQHGLLVRAGMRMLAESGVVEVLQVDFGPRVYRRSSDLTMDWIFSEGTKHIPIFATYKQINSREWLQEAMKDVNGLYARFAFKPDDFENPPASLWEPLPLDRSDEQLVEATAKIDEAIEKIEADNGYAANVPGERDFVLQSLKSFSKELKESAQITGMQIRTFALEPLALVAKRFTGAALELVAGAAKEALVNWLRTKFGALIAALLS